MLAALAYLGSLFGSDAGELNVQPAPRRSRLLVVYVAGNDATSRKRQVYVEDMWRSLEAPLLPAFPLPPWP